MDETTKATREEAATIATMVVAALQADPAVAVCETVANLTGQTLFDNKVYLKLTSGEVFRFNVSPIRTRDSKA